MTAPVARLSRPSAAPAPFEWLSAYTAGSDVTAADASIAPEAVIRLPDRVLEGPAALMADALAQRAALTGAQVLGEESVLADTRPGPGEENGGLAMATRATILAQHGGTGVYGPASGRPLRMRVMADLWQRDGLIRDIWMIRDTAAVLQQAAGTDPRSWVESLLAGPQASRLPSPLTPENDPEPAYLGRGTANPEAESLADILDRVMGGEISAISGNYDPACELSHPGGETALGHAAAEAFWTGLRSALPGASFRIEHRIGHAPSRGAPVAALRWSLYGRHDGFGRFGAPSGSYVYVMGLTQAEFGPRGVRREWTLIDDLAVWTQILSPGSKTRAER
ncbi:MAG: nuclear transport factor 2 family protein [Rhodobacteraceae bacterium]|nr:nuclear transport factor 2 family protein [Paracoccaceae bacterium]